MDMAAYIYNPSTRETEACHEFMVSLGTRLLGPYRKTSLRKKKKKKSLGTSEEDEGTHTGKTARKYLPESNKTYTRQ